MDPEFLTVAEVLFIHQDQLDRYGGASGIRDIERLKSAVGMPSATYGGEFLRSDIYQMAAAYLFHIVNNHPFVDGNKRAGAVSALVFLTLNGSGFNASEDDFFEMVMATARGEKDKVQVASFIRTWATRS